MDPKIIPSCIIAIAFFLIGFLAGRLLPRMRTKGGQPRSAQRAGGNEEIELYVGNLSYDMTERDLAGAFESFGTVASARIIKHRFGGKSKGFGFVEMTNEAESSAAIRALNGKDLKGRRIVVNEAKSRARD